MANPASSILGPLKERTFLYWINTDGVLGMNQYTDATDTWDSNDCPIAATVPTPNHISAVYINGVIRVYGMIGTKPVTKPPSYIVSELSPTVRYVPASKNDKTAMTTILDKLVVLTDEKKKSWFYYFTRKTEDAPVVLRASYQETGNPFSHSTVEKVTPVADSQLTGVYLPETNTRVLFYQTATDEICAVTISDGKAFSQELDNTATAMKSTPMAATFTGGDKDRVIFLYYLDNKAQLNKATGTWNGSSWVFNSQSTILGTTQKADKTTQLTVTNDRNGTNRLFFIDDQNSHYTEIKDNQKQV